MSATRLSGCLGGKVDPSEEIGTESGPFMEFLKGGGCLRVKGLDLLACYGLKDILHIDFDCFHVDI